MAKKVAFVFRRLGLDWFLSIGKKIIPERFRYCVYYKLPDFLQYYDEEFVRNAYRGILKREPDLEGLNYFLARLRNGEQDRIEVLGRLRYSKEGRNKNVKIRSILFQFILNIIYNKIPIIGYFLHFLTALLRLPVILKNINQFEAYCNTNFAKNNNQFDELLNSTNEIRQELTNNSDEIRQELTNNSNQLNQEINNILRQINEQKYSILDQKIRLTSLLKEARKRLPEPFSVEQIENIIKEDDHMLDAIYVAFEDEFRGRRDDIKERCKVYIPYLEQIKKKIGTFTTLDIGCGRGEWLELLKENRFTAQGIDINRIMVQQCKDLELEVDEADAIFYLSEQESNSIGIITGFHIIEHLNLKILITLIEESLRVLIPGGILIFETPNPENIIVGSCNFYVDPTHNRPIPPITSKFLLESRGFCKTDIVRFNRFESQNQEYEFPFNLFHGKEDYAVIGYKA